MRVLKSVPQKPYISMLPTQESITVTIRLTPQDHKTASAAAKSQGESLAEWISGLVNTALQP